MTLVAKNKIIEYIDKHPEARVSLLAWLKAYPYQEQRMFSDHHGKLLQGSGAGSAQPDLGVYSIKYNINYSAKAVFITWVGTWKELEEENERKFKELQQNHPDLKVTTIVLKSRSHKSLKQSGESRKTNVNSHAVSSLHVDPEGISQTDLNRDLFKEQSFETEAAYKQGLLKISDIFDAHPDTQEFTELLTLLYLVKNYEEELKFPQFKVLEFIIHRMDMFKLSSLDLATMLKSTAVYPFLLGEQELPPKILTRLYKILSIRFPTNDQHYI